MLGRVSAECVDGLEERHAAEGHTPYDKRCPACWAQQGRHAAHRRADLDLVRLGTCAFDLTQLNKGDAFVLIAVCETEEGKRYHAKETPTKGEEDLRAVVFQSVCEIEYFYGSDVIRRAHGDRESGLGALDAELASRGIHLTVTTGGDPAANGWAECGVGILTRKARTSISYLSDRMTRRRFWGKAVVHAGFWESTAGEDGANQKISRSELLPFGAKCQARLRAKDSVDGNTVTGAYLAPSHCTPGGTDVAVYERRGGKLIFRNIITSLSVAALKNATDSYIFEDFEIEPTARDRLFHDRTELTCSSCGQARTVEASKASKLGNSTGGFKCHRLQGCECTTETSDKLFVPEARPPARGGHVRRSRGRQRTTRSPRRPRDRQEPPRCRTRGRVLTRFADRRHVHVRRHRPRLSRHARLHAR